MIYWSLLAAMACLTAMVAWFIRDLYQQLADWVEDVLDTELDIYREIDRLQRRAMKELEDEEADQ